MSPTGSSVPGETAAEEGGSGVAVSGETSVGTSASGAVEGGSCSADSCSSAILLGGKGGRKRWLSVTSSNFVSYIHYGAMSVLNSPTMIVDLPIFVVLSFFLILSVLLGAYK